MADKITSGDMLPQFTLPAIGGGEISTALLKGKKNLILYLFDIECAGCVEFLDSLAQIAPACRDLQSEIIAVGRGTAEQLAELLDEKVLPFPVAADADGQIRDRLGGSEATTIVTDRFGEVRERTDSTGEQMPDPQRLLDILSLIELECPECGIATWRA